MVYKYESDEMVEEMLERLGELETEISVERQSSYPNLDHIRSLEYITEELRMLLLIYT